MSMNNLKNNNNNKIPFVVDSIIKNSLEYYDSYQLKIQDILNKIDYIKVNYKNNINDEYIFYDCDDNIIFSSSVETLSIFIPQTKTWKWSWSIPFSKYKNTLISREILKYAFTLNPENDLFLKSTLVNSKIIIKNNYQLDIYIALSSMLSKKPFILKLYLVPWEEKYINNKNTEYIYYYKKIHNEPNINKYISVFLIIVDY